jgi:hypothetical protein
MFFPFLLWSLFACPMSLLIMRDELRVPSWARLHFLPSCSIRSHTSPFLSYPYWLTAVPDLSPSQLPILAHYDPQPLPFSAAHTGSLHYPPLLFSATHTGSLRSPTSPLLSYPYWLTTVPDLHDRTSSPGWEAEMGKFFNETVSYFRERGFFPDKGGNIALAQVLISLLSCALVHCTRAGAEINIVLCACAFHSRRC